MSSTRTCSAPSCMARTPDYLGSQYNICACFLQSVYSAACAWFLQSMYSAACVHGSFNPCIRLHVYMMLARVRLLLMLLLLLFLVPLWRPFPGPKMTAAAASLLYGSAFLVSSAAIETHSLLLFHLGASWLSISCANTRLAAGTMFSLRCWIRRIPLSCALL